MGEKCQCGNQENLYRNYYQNGNIDCFAEAKDLKSWHNLRFLGANEYIALSVYNLVTLDCSADREQEQDVS